MDVTGKLRLPRLAEHAGAIREAVEHARQLLAETPPALQAHAVVMVHEMLDAIRAAVERAEFGRVAGIVEDFERRLREMIAN